MGATRVSSPERPVGASVGVHPIEGCQFTTYRASVGAFPRQRFKKESPMDNNNYPKSKVDSNDAHPVATGVGAAGGAVTGAVVGTAVGGPIGTVVGGAVGAATGAVTGQTVAEKVHPK